MSSSVVFVALNAVVVIQGRLLPNRPSNAGEQTSRVRIFADVECMI